MRQALEFLFGTLSLGRPLALPPDTQRDRADTLIKATLQAMADADFLEDAKKQQIDIEVSDGSTTAEMVDVLYDTPASVVAKLQSALAH